VDFNEYPFFGMVFVETSLGNEKELDQILNSDLKKYIKKRTKNRRFGLITHFLTARIARFFARDAKCLI
jgi:hypothetical protein